MDVRCHWRRYEVARRPSNGVAPPCDVRTYALEDVEALAARLAKPAAVDPLWVAVESGTRLTAKTAVDKFPILTQTSINRAPLPFQLARKPSTSPGGAQEVKTYALEDVEALAKRSAPPPASKKRPRSSDVVGEIATRPRLQNPPMPSTREERMRAILASPTARALFRLATTRPVPKCES